MNDTTPLIKLNRVSKTYALGKKSIHALQNISLEIYPGTTLGVVGESGCGKSTLGRIALKLENVTNGEVFFHNTLLNPLSSKQMQPLRRQMQMIFQDPYSSLNPRLTIEQIISEGLIIHKLGSKETQKEIITQLILDVGMDPLALQRYPHEFSGGQKQRIGIARALAINPRFLVCDEPLSALDTCTQKQVMELLWRFKRKRQLTYLFISHDLHAVEEISDRVAVMYLGHLVEIAPVKQIYSNPAHPYTEALIDAAPIPDPLKERTRKRLTLYGEAPSLLHPPKGCPFHQRCPKAMQICREAMPKLQEKSSDHFVACHLK